MRTRSYPRRPIRRRLPTLPALEFVFGQVICPGCGDTGTLQHTEMQLRWWNPIDVVPEDGTVLLDDGGTCDDGDDQKWSCYSCGGEWDYESGPEVSFG